MLYLRQTTWTIVVAGGFLVDPNVHALSLPNATQTTPRPRAMIKRMRNNGVVRPVPMGCCDDADARLLKATQRKEKCKMRRGVVPTSNGVSLTALTVRGFMRRPRSR